jgi:hypothetical protein
MEGVPFANGAPHLCVDIPALIELAADLGLPVMGKDFKTGQTLIKTVIAPMLKARMLGLSGWFSSNILGNLDGEVLDDPESFRSKEVSKLGVTITTKSGSTTIPRAATTKKGGITSTSSGGWAIRCRSKLTSFAGIQFSPHRLSLTSSCFSI